MRWSGSTPLSGFLWLTLLVPMPASAADRAHPTVVEEYQSQGCSSCPPANANLNAIADRPEILALSFSVTYWDRLGWKDTFGQKIFTDRQWEYARAGGRGNIYTPQMVVNGSGVLVGNHADALEAAIEAHDRGTGGPEIAISGDRVSISSAPVGPEAVVWLVRYDPRARRGGGAQRRELRTHAAASQRGEAS